MKHMIGRRRVGTWLTDVTWATAPVSASTKVRITKAAFTPNPGYNLHWQQKMIPLHELSKTWRNVGARPATHMASVRSMVRDGIKMNRIAFLISLISDPPMRKFHVTNRSGYVQIGALGIHTRYKVLTWPCDLVITTYFL